jgi:hypothetical protein
MGVNTNAVDLASTKVGSMIHEEVMDKLYNIDPVERPFIDMIGNVSADNPYTEFVERSLRARKIDNAAVDGQDVTAKKGDVGKRFGAYHQILLDNVAVSERASNVDTIARQDELLFQVAMIQKELRRDEEAIKLYPQAAQAGDGLIANAASTGPAKMAGAPAWIRTNRKAIGAAPQLSDNSAKAGYPKVAPTAGAIRALSDTDVKDLLEMIFTAGGNPSKAISHPSLIRRYSSFHFTSSARIATLQSDMDQGSSMGKGMTAYGAVNILATDFGITLELIPDRQYVPYDGATGTGNACDLLIIDPEYWANSTLQGYETKPLAKTGLSEHYMVTADLGLICYQEKSSGIVADLDFTAAVVA